MERSTAERLLLSPECRLGTFLVRHRRDEHDGKGSHAISVL